MVLERYEDIADRDVHVRRRVDISKTLETRSMDTAAPELLRGSPDIDIVHKSRRRRANPS